MKKRLSQSSRLTGWPNLPSLRMISSNCLTRFYSKYKFSLRRSKLSMISNLSRRNVGVHSFSGDSSCPCLRHNGTWACGRVMKRQINWITWRRWECTERSMTVISESAFAGVPIWKSLSQYPSELEVRYHTCVERSSIKFINRPHPIWNVDG
jgi:hypothetical protein